MRPGAATKCVGASGAGPGPNAVRPYKMGKMLAKKNKHLRRCNAESPSSETLRFPPRRPPILSLQCPLKRCRNKVR